MFRLALVTIVLTVLPIAGFAQFQTDCTNATLDSGSTLPISDTEQGTGAAADFTLSGSCTPLGSSAFSDIVVCFTPTNSCDVQFTCDTAGGSNLLASIADQTCNANFSSCVAQGSDVAPPTDSVASASLTGGQAYCFICQNTVGNATFNADITATSGDCGALPVSLESFAIEDDR